MSDSRQTVVGIDVGGKRKGFHAVALRNGRFIETKQFTTPTPLADWCLKQDAHIVAVDAPCKWSQSGGSRRAERDLRVGGQIIQCFKTPTRERAVKHRKGFYGWVFNGEQLYQHLALHYRLFDGELREGLMVFESFPHAVVCALAGRVVPTKPKATVRRAALRARGYDVTCLVNIDFVDAALCAVAAEAFLKGCVQCFGDEQEGFIVVPA